MRHLIERVLELSEEEEGPAIRPTSVEEMESNDTELRKLLESLQPRIRVYGVGGAGCNAVSRLHEEGLFENCLLLLKSPFISLTHFPSIKSIAGMSFIIKSFSLVT